MNVLTLDSVAGIVAASSEKSNWAWATNIFTFIGMVVSIIVTLIAIVWLTCFVVKLLIKSFNVRVGKSYEIMVEDINKKAEAKKERKELKRQAAFEQKKELLNMKLESKARVHEMKKEKLADKLESKEQNKKYKLFGDEAENVEVKIKKPESKEELVEDTEEVVEEVQKPKTSNKKSSKKHTEEE